LDQFLLSQLSDYGQVLGVIIVLVEVVARVIVSSALFAGLVALGMLQFSVGKAPEQMRFAGLRHFRLADWDKFY
jgi:hypothetical protein